MQYSTILTGTDFSPVAEWGVDAAAELAWRLGASQLHVAHVIDQSALDALAGPEDEGRRKEIIEGMESRLLQLKRSPENVEVSLKALVGIPNKALSELAGSLGADLLVIASHGRRGWSAR